MRTTTITPSNERHSSTAKESSSRVKHERFREHYNKKVEKVEEEKKKRPSIFEVVAEENPLSSPAKFSIHSPNESTVAINAVSMNKEQIDWIVEQATLNIAHCIKDGVKETSIRLDGASFNGSSLQGMELIIQEFSTAPLIFNIAFRGSSSALAFLQPHLQALSAALHADKKADYAINRIETELEDDSSRFFFRRKPDLEDNPRDARG